MRTTLNLPDDLIARAKAVAAREHTTLAALLTDGLRLRIAQARPAGTRRPLPVEQVGGGLQAWIDPSSNASLYGAAHDAPA